MESIPLLRAVGRVNYEDIRAHINQPPFNCSAIDGYAVRAKDITAAGKQAVILRVTQTVFAGDTPARALGPGESAQVTTGAQLPLKADCVVKQEETKYNNGLAHILANPGKGKNLIFSGEHIRRGEILARRGELLESSHIGILAGQGFREVKVYRKAKVGILSTGNELISAGAVLMPGKIYDSNCPMLAARVRLLGGEAVFHSGVEDDIDRLGHTIAALLEEAEVVITTGGVSVGKKDFLPQAGILLGAETLICRLRYKPGGRVLVLLKEGKLIFCLSGNPFAALTSFELLAAPCLRKLMGALDYEPQYAAGVLQHDFTKQNPLRRFVRARIINGQVFLPAGVQRSGSLAGLPGCNCMIDIAAGTGELRKGDTVRVIMFLGGSLL